jgi:hypothetical protein
MRISDLYVSWNDGYDTGSTHYRFEVEEKVAGKEKEQIKLAANHFLNTEEGKELNYRVWKDNFCCGDIVYIPASFFDAVWPSCGTSSQA